MEDTLRKKFTNNTRLQVTHTQQELQQKSNRGIFNPSIMEHRDRLAAAMPMIKPANVRFLDVLVPVRDDMKIPIRTYIPNGRRGALPTIFYIPGTAFIAAEIKFTHVICSHLCELTKSQVIVINHRLAPENQFPKGYEDTYDVFKFFMREMPEQYLIDKNHIAIVGYSSGGNFAATMALQARKDGIAVAQQVLISPLVDLSHSLPDYEEYEQQDKTISEEFINFFLKLYVPENINLRDPRLSPFWRSVEEIKDVPSTAIIVAKYDRFRSDAEHYYKKLLSADVKTERFVIDAEDHSYLWYKLEVVEKVAEIVTAAFMSETINHIGIPKHHLISNIVPRFEANKKKESHEEKSSIMSETKKSMMMSKYPLFAKIAPQLEANKKREDQREKPFIPRSRL